MDFLDKLINEFNTIYDTEIDRSEYPTPDHVITLFMNSSKQNHFARLRFLTKAYEDASQECAEAADYGVDLYDENILPVLRAMDFSINELLVENDGDVDLCLEYITGVLGSIPDQLKAILAPRINYSKQDSLSRLLEGSDMCSAITIINHTINITTNSIIVGKKGGVIPAPYNGYLNRVMSYLLNGDDEEHDITRDSIFLEICTQRLAQESKKGLALPSELMSHISQELLTDHHTWRDRSPNQTMALLKSSGINSPLIRHQILAVYSILDRVAHDFKKIEKEFLHKGFKYEILAIGSDAMHAEMKMIDHLIDNVLFKEDGGLPKTYISISKLCCADCQNSIKTINQAVKNLYGIDDFISYGSTSSRDGHGVQFSRWEKPHFIAREISSYHSIETKQICEEVRKLYKPAVKKAKGDKDWHDMYATESDSEDETKDKLVKPFKPLPEPTGELHAKTLKGKSLSESLEA